MLASYPAAGQGLDCDTTSDDCGVDRNTVLQFRFDRYLLPATTVRQAIRLGSGDVLTFFSQPEYDLVERVLIYRPAAPLPPKTTIRIELIVPSEDEPDGLRAFDGAPLDPNSPAPLEFDFHTNGLDPEPVAIPPEPAPSCTDVITTVFTFSNGCAACHTPGGKAPCPAGFAPDAEQKCVPVPRMGLDLTSFEGLLTTAIGKVAHQTEIGAKGGTPLENPPRLGVQMPIVDSGRPDNSYMMYKLLRNERNFPELGSESLCDTRYQVGFLPGGPCLPPTAEESTRLREWFVRGQPMPADPEKPLFRAQLRDIQSWIRAGAVCP